MIWIVAGVVLVSIMSTTAADRAQASKRLARWNPLFITIIFAGLAIMLWPWPPHSH